MRAKTLGLLVIIFLAGLFGFSGCASLYVDLAARLTPSAQAVLPTGPAALTVTAAVSIGTPTLPDSCAFVWSNRSLPDVATEINQAFRKQGLAEVEVEASAYGENCLDPTTNEVVRFSAMQTDFFLNVVVDSVEDHQDLGEWIEKLMRVLNEFPPGRVPGSTPGMVGISFTSASDVVDLTFPISKGKNLIDEGLKGSDLFDALNGS